MAYTSAITMCGGPDMYMAENNWASYLPIVLSFVIIAMILINNRGLRTYYALFVSIVGAVSITLVHQLILPEYFYYLGTGLLFLGIMVNSSLLALYYAIQKLIYKKSKQAI